MGSKVQSKAIRAQKRNWFVMKFWKVVSIDQKFYAELKIVHFMGSV
jgi:hypothetical protein